MDAGSISDVVGDNDLTLLGSEGTDYDWTEDRGCRPQRALQLHGSGEAYAATAAAVVGTDVSFSVAAWVVPGAAAADDQVVLSQSGATSPAMLLEHTGEGSWRFAVPSVSPARSGGVAETAPGSVKLAVWNHLAGVVDMVEGELRLYVNGELAATGEVPATVWQARGPFYLGVAGTMHDTESPFQGTMDNVAVWSGRLLESQIRDMGIGGGFPPCF
jgi:hypothetical protein